MTHPPVTFYKDEDLYKQREENANIEIALEGVYVVIRETARLRNVEVGQEVCHGGEHAMTSLCRA